jgi:heme exporter protein D
MTWSSAGEFFSMGGYALYVWGSFGACALALALEPVLVARRRGRVLHSLRQRALADQLDKESP